MGMCWRHIRLWAALGILAALNIAARPYTPLQQGEIMVNGIVFHDANGNQRQDARERGLANISVISQAPDAQGGAVNASTVTAADGSFAIQTHVGDRITIVPSAGYKALQPSGFIVREGTQTLAFPLYIDKVVVDRVIRMEPAAVTMPAPQVYVSPLITVPAPVVNIAPAEVRIAPAEVTVQPAPVHIAPLIEPTTLWAAIAAISLSAVVSAAVIGSAIRGHARTLRDVADGEARCSALQKAINMSNWRSVAEQIIADSTGQVIAVEAMVYMTAHPVPCMWFRATNSHVFTFSMARKADNRCALHRRQVANARRCVSSAELRALWRFFAEAMHLPRQLPKRQAWCVAIIFESHFGDCQRFGLECVSSTDAHPISYPKGLGRKDHKSCEQNTFGLRQADELSLDSEKDQFLSTAFIDWTERGN